MLIEDIQKYAPNIQYDEWGTPYMYLDDAFDFNKVPFFDHPSERPGIDLAMHACIGSSIQRASEFLQYSFLNLSSFATVSTDPLAIRVRHPHARVLMHTPVVVSREMNRGQWDFHIPTDIDHYGNGTLIDTNGELYENVDASFYEPLLACGLEEATNHYNPRFTGRHISHCIENNMDGLYKIVPLECQVPFIVEKPYEFFQTISRPITSLIHGIIDEEQATDIIGGRLKHSIDTFYDELGTPIHKSDIARNIALMAINQVAQVAFYSSLFPYSVRFWGKGDNTWSIFPKVDELEFTGQSIRFLEKIKFRSKWYTQMQDKILSVGRGQRESLQQFLASDIVSFSRYANDIP